MSDRRRRIRNRRSRRTSRWLVAIQLVIMAGVLIFIFVFRDFLSASASNIFSAFESDDLAVSADVETDAGRSTSTRPGRTTPRLRITTPDDAGTITKETVDTGSDAADE